MPFSGSPSGRDIVKDRVEQRLQVLVLVVQVADAVAVTRRRVEERALELLIRGVQIHHQLQRLVHDLLRSRLRAVDLVDADDDGKIEIQRLLQHKFRLGHRPLERVHQQDDAVDHLQHTLDLAAEVRMPRRIDDINLHALVGDGGVFRKDRDAALPLDVARVHDALLHLLVLPERAALTEHSVHQRRLAVIDMRDDGNVSDIFSLDDTHTSLTRLLCLLATTVKYSTISRALQERPDPAHFRTLSPRFPLLLGKCSPPAAADCISN